MIVGSAPFGLKFHDPYITFGGTQAAEALEPCVKMGFYLAAIIWRVEMVRQAELRADRHLRVSGEVLKGTAGLFREFGDLTTGRNVIFVEDSWSIRATNV